MAPSTRRRSGGAAPSGAELHRRWLELVDTDGPFLAVAPLKRVWPNGIPDFRSTYPQRFEILVEARKEFEAAWEALDRNPDSEAVLQRYREARDRWVETVLRDVVGWADSLQWGEPAAVPAQSPNRAVAVKPQAALVGTDGMGALVHVVDPTDSLRLVPSDLWAATPVDRLQALLDVNNVRIGIVTDGRWWGLVHSGDGAMAASGVVDALTWIEEPRTRDAFLTLVGRQYLIGGDPDERLPVLFSESVAAAEEITEALGAQVRRAVELLIQSFSESAADAVRRGQPDPLPQRTHEIYEAAVTVMMRTVFLLFAEERGLLPSGELFEQGYGISRELDRLDAESAPGEEALDATALTWHRLLATSQALFGGASFENLRMPAYGGSLFDPARFPFVSATTEHGTLAISVSDRVMMHVLRSVQVATVKGEARRISFRDIDVEQIGYIYEGLLGYTCATVAEPVLGLGGTEGAEPEIPLAVLEGLAEHYSEPKALAEAIRDWVASDQPSAKAKSASAIAKALQADVDASAVSAITQVVGDDDDLRDRIVPFLGLIRNDLRSRPFVVLTGGLLVKETPSRRNAGAHYTPRSLAEEVVLHALQPLCYSPGPHQTADEETWVLRSSDEILDLKVADIACGSGAFLVAAARYLAERVVEAWAREDPANEHRKDLYTRAIRQVVANCLYGADINDMAVEMCKLSLWLVSLDRDLPFSFVDDKVFVGNSLLGLTSLDQLRKLHIDPSRVPMDTKFDIFDVDIDAIIRRAVDLRARLATEIVEDDPARNSAAKHRQLHELHQVTADLRQIADGVIAAGLPLGGKPGKALDEAYDDLRLAVKAAHPGPGEAPNTTWLEGLIDRGLTPTVNTDYERWQPLHWVLEAPDVMVVREGFDVVVGNPPFVRGSDISAALGSEFREWLVNWVANGRRGNADVVAYFVLRAAALVSVSGALGLIATNTIAQTDTREVGLEQLVDGGLEILRAVQSRPWPSKLVSLYYSVVWATWAEVSPDLPRIADELMVGYISPLLEAEGRVRGLPVQLRENLGLSYYGCKIDGMGFIISREEAVSWVNSDSSNRAVIRPVLNGEDLNSDPHLSSSRWVIDFDDRSIASAREFALPFARVEQEVRPIRASNNRAARRERWWQYGENAPGLRASIAKLEEVIVIALTSKSLMPVRVKSDQVFTHALGVFATDSYALQAVLSSSAHQLWAIKYGSGMRNDPRYTLSDVFETFPRPEATGQLDAIGQSLDAKRIEIMSSRQLGITKLYNLVNDGELTDTADSSAAQLRAIHVELDEAVMSAYGWSDIPLNHGFHAYRHMDRWTVCPAARVEILDRLLAENHRRGAIEAEQSPPAPKGRRAKKALEGMEELFS